MVRQPKWAYLFAASYTASAVLTTLASHLPPSMSQYKVLVTFPVQQCLRPLLPPSQQKLYSHMVLTHQAILSIQPNKLCCPSPPPGWRQGPSIAVYSSLVGRDKNSTYLVWRTAQKPE